MYPSSQTNNTLPENANTQNTTDSVPQVAPQTTPEQPVVVNSMPTETPSTPPAPTNTGGGNIFKKIIVSFFVFLLLLIIAGAGSMYALAYHKFELTQFPEFQKKVEFLVMELPFTPKSGRFLLYKASLVDKSYTSHSFDISAAINTSGTQTDVFGLSNFDFAAKGEVDYSDVKNTILSMNMSITKDINIDLISKDKILYFKINKLPSTILAVMGLNTEILSPLMNIWVSYDTTPLDSEARELLDQSNKTEESEETQISEKLIKLFDEEIANEINVVTEEDENGVSVHKLSLSPTDEMLNKIIIAIAEEVDPQYSSEFYIQGSQSDSTKPSDTIRNSKIEVWLDAKNYYTRRLSTSFTITPNQKLSDTNIDQNNVLGLDSDTLFGEDSEIKVALVGKFSDFGKTIEVETPTDSVTLDEYSTMMSAILLQLYTTPTETVDDEFILP